MIRNLLITIVVSCIFFIGTNCGKGGGTEPPPVDTTPTNTNTFTNPLLSSGPDPWVIQKDGYYYYTHTLGNRIALWKTQKIENLRSVTPVTVWTAPTINVAYSNDVWAPELHYVNNKWYIYFAADSSGINSTHRIYVLENEAADPTTGTWTFKGKLTDPTNKWAIDASVFTYNGINYAVWSGWQGSVDGEQDIFIAKLSNPYTIEGERVMIAQPTYEWETKITGGINVKVNEGPEALKNAAGKLFITFSAGGCWSDDYALGLLTLKENGDPMNAADWTKLATPVFTKNTFGGAYGPGHNGFFKSPDGTEDWIIYHANPNAGQGCGDARSPRAQPFTWNANGTPNFGTPVSVGAKIEKPSGE